MDVVLLSCVSGEIIGDLFVSVGKVKIYVEKT